MSTADNKRLIEQYFAFGRQGDNAAAAELLHEDFVYTCKGKTPETIATCGKAALVAAQERAPALWKTPVTITVLGMTAEDDRVAVEAESHGELHSGQHYNNAYHFLIRVKDGKIASIDEYFCTATFTNVIFTARGTPAGT